MKIASILAVGSLVFFAIQAGASPLATATEAELEERVRQSPKLYLPALVEATEAKLERVYREKVDAQPASMRESLSRSHDTWRKYLDAEMAYRIADSRENGGSAIYLLQARLYLLRQRIYQLQTPFEAGWPEIPKQ